MKRKNGDGTCFFIGSKNLFCYQVMLDGHKKSFYGKTEHEAYKKMMEYDNRETMSFKKWALYWLKTYKINDYKTGTYDKEIRRLNNIICTFEESNLNLSDIKPNHIQKYINTLLETKKPKTIKNYLMLINGAFKQALKENLIDTNPCDYISIPKTNIPDMIALSRPQKDLFLSINKTNPYYDIFVFALNTGMRISEICGLQKENVDIEKGLIYIKEQLVRIKGKVFLDTPKTKESIRTIPLNEITKSILAKHIEKSHDSYVFHNPITNNILYQNTLSINAHRCFLKCYEITKKEVYLKANFHSFRHTFATLWIVQGGNVNLLSKVLGHTDTAFTMRVYVQPDYDDIKNEMNSLVF